MILIVKLCWQKQTPCTLWCFSAFEFELDFLKLSQKDGAIQIGTAESATRASASSLQLCHWVLTIASHSFCSWQTGEVFPAVIGFNANKALTMTVMFRHACLALTSLFTYCVLMGHASASLMIGSLVSGVRQSAVLCSAVQRCAVCYKDNGANWTEKNRFMSEFAAGKHTCKMKCLFL